MTSGAGLHSVAVRTLHGLSIAAGVGGIDLGLRLALGDAYRTVCYVERETHCAKVLAARMADKALEDAPIWSDLKSFDGRPWRCKVDILAAGLPCQPYSLAGSQRGHADERAIWPELIRVTRECEPALVFLENVPRFLQHFEPVYDALREMGFVLSPPGLYTAAECGAPHIRKRVFILAAHPQRIDLRDQPWRRCWESGQAASQPREYGWHIGYDERLRGCKAGSPWTTESPVFRVDDGPANRVDELRAIGNGVVPEVAARAFTDRLALLTDRIPRSP